MKRSAEHESSRKTTKFKKVENPYLSPYAQSRCQAYCTPQPGDVDNEKNTMDKKETAESSINVSKIPKVQNPYLSSRVSRQSEKITSPASTTFATAPGKEEQVTNIMTVEQQPVIDEVKTIANFSTNEEKEIREAEDNLLASIPELLSNTKSNVEEQSKTGNSEKIDMKFYSNIFGADDDIDIEDMLNDKEIGDDELLKSLGYSEHYKLNEEDGKYYCKLCETHTCIWNDIEDEILKMVRDDFGDDVVVDENTRLWKRINQPSLDCEIDIKESRKKRWKLYEKIAHLEFGENLGKDTQVTISRCNEYHVRSMYPANKYCGPIDFEQCSIVYTYE